MHELLKKKWFQVALGVILLVVWIVNIHSFIKLSSNDGVVRLPPEMKTEKMAMNIVTNRQDTFRADFRDPFQPEIRKRIRKADPAPQRRPPKKDPFPEVILIGIIEKRAVLKSENRNVFFASVGDTVAGVRVLSVGQDSVRVETTGKPHRRKTLKILYR
ncbi:MAG TPA: hypothetical protein VKA08_19390 [Balneolales bacterium]|nr:hypothetical protein [Balneolales bacterium]